ncbi:hypothetical protein EPUS_04583 [Endocarpon pusillum Z07020]|uniref:Peroxin-19 n=1 Tax=Endocarpon pusillum (strain Z07020 / HMAS-L-300199) TaxID=1263415 RepID=U1GT62_ENDPU|nr:uncharacterized protein EPUS_04583 [Endocarpon pusillum Z07020]ERF75603.1 hypothetical protein EPUS_04583 [Endocarpon pusillum Z07020]
MSESKGDAQPHNEAEAPPTSAPVTKPVTADDDSDPDFDDLDGDIFRSCLLYSLRLPRCLRPDVLDQFSSAHEQPTPQPNVQPQQPTPSSSGPGRPSSSGTTPMAAPSLMTPESSESEEAFLARLALEMSSVLGNLNPDPSASTASAEDISTMGKELEEFTSTMEKQGLKPEDLLKAILGDDLPTEAPPPSAIPSTDSKPQPSAQNPSKASSSSSGEKESFDSTIRRTMERMQASDSNATNAATKPTAEGTTGEEEDMLATLLKALETSRRWHQRHHLCWRPQLRRPPQQDELDSKYPEWLAKKKGELPDEDYKRYEGQRGVVREIVAKFEEKAYSDEDSRCREFIWERMQKMQAMGSPPEDLIANPFPGMMGGGGGSGKQDDAGCPTQ